MAIRLAQVSSMVGLMAATLAFAPAALAQEAQPQLPTIPDAFDDLMSTYSGDFFSNRTISRQGARIVGFGFPEKELEWDAHATSAVFRELMRLQNTADPTLRVPDLANPYSSSLLTMPSTQVPLVGTEFIFERF
ncbi:hypothetical protein GFS31_31470 [Leptolyngbya sp. BL0902]|uniref:hypothetical protein n=1 Tax=Leptolyngbya sp. BL0902 TaxID=1115757 RepID=UPI0018E7FDD6|nr:hypothetical protein [Leptolyngbya sp. BL0902]QQE66449.1 hypothetical protein GFS31_31470 [Leptolyngbya sp. BL0902]